ncbi:hypothetical protein [Acinetobacter brisouii]|uniref:hypothetical protein n=1 Tax=Acinetobacter brisouii TaxID=396323 RepID=UPI0005F85B61|nr:hypothetical protein [Acinetobacter brisouii]KJV37838.1 hypothetical protein VH98_11610 [Acinetobacter brisouii]
MIRKAQPNLATSQKGVATVLTVMLVGVALAVAILSTAYYIRSKQQAAVSSHAVTNAQEGAWSGVEILRKYLESLSTAQLSSLSTGAVSIGVIGITASINSITPPATSTDPYQIIATIKNTSTTAQAASTIQVLYNVMPTSTSSSSTGTGTSTGTTSAMDIYSNLDLSGGITFSQNGTGNVSINVYGDFSTGGVGLKGIDTLNTTGNVTLTSSAQINNIYSNGNVNLTGSASAQLISAKGWINITGGGTQGDLYADQYISLGGGVNVNTAHTLSYIDWKSGGIAKAFTAGSYVNISNGQVNTTQAKGNVTMSGWPTVTNVTSEGLLTCTSVNWSSYSLLNAVTFKSCPTTNTKILAAGTNSIVATGALVTVTAPSKPIVNALSYESQANYILSVDSSKNIIVTVQNVNGIPNGNYRIAKYVENYNTYVGQLCSSVDNKNICTSTPVGYIYPKYSRADVIAYSGGTWSLNTNGNSGYPALAPGVFLFKGDLKPLQGQYVDTFLATGSIDYGGSINLQAPNYAGASVVCNSTDFGRPTNLCSSSTSLIPASIGNIALLAGSCTNTTTVALCQSTYTGGNISLGAQATVYGNVIAGNLLSTSGSSTIVGSLSAAGLGDTSKGSKFTGSTTIDLSTLKDHPDFSTGTGSTNTSSGTTTTTTITATIQWARYL